MNKSNMHYFREVKGITMSKLSLLTHLSSSMLYNMENNRGVKNHNAWIKVAKVLEVKVGELNPDLKEYESFIAANEPPVKPAYALNELISTLIKNNDRYCLIQAYEVIGMYLNK